MGCVEGTTSNNAKRSDMEEYTRKFRKRPRGMYLEPIDTDSNNLYVVRVGKYSVANRANVTVGSRVISVNGKSVQGKKTNIILNKIANSRLPLSITFIRPKIIETKIKIKPKSNAPFTLSKILELSFYIQTPPIIKGKQVILLHTNNETNQTKYCIIDLNKRQIIKDEVDIKCDPTFDVFNTVYALNERNNIVYFIENNKDILKWDLNENQIVSLHETITTTNDNYANIIFMNDELYLLGAENTEQTSTNNSNYFIIPYSTAMKRKSQHEYTHRIRRFGQFSRVINVKFNELDYILIMGGERNNFNNINNLPCPSHIIWQYVILSHPQSIVSKCVHSFANYCISIPTSVISVIYDFYCIRDYDQIDIYEYMPKSKSMSRSRWAKCYLPLLMNSNGVINYKHRYLFLFGGNAFTLHGNKKQNCIFVLPLKNDDEYNLREGMWYECSRKLPVKDYFHAIYNGGEIVHLFSYSGIYYTLSIQSILDVLKNVDLFERHARTETCGFVLPEEFNSAVLNMGIKEHPTDH